MTSNIHERDSANKTSRHTATHPTMPLLSIPWQPCYVCGHKESESCCYTCRARWCADCEVKGRRAHYVACVSLASLESPASDKHKAAILFPSDSEDPRFIRVKTFYNESTKSQDFEARGGLQLLQRKWKILAGKIPQGREFNYTLEITYRNTMLTDDSADNQSIKKVTNAESNFSWKGPVLVMLREGSVRKGRPNYGDMKMRQYIDTLELLSSGHFLEPICQSVDAAQEAAGLPRLFKPIVSPPNYRNALGTTASSNAITAADPTRGRYVDQDAAAKTPPFADFSTALPPDKKQKRKELRKFFGRNGE